MKIQSKFSKERKSPGFKPVRSTLFLSPYLFLQPAWVLLATFLFSFSPGYAGIVNKTRPAHTVQSFAGGEFYVSPTGSASGDGSMNNPWDLQTALNQPAAVVPGSTIWLKPGTYKGTFTSKLTGNASSPILVKGMPGSRAIIDGSRAGQAVKNVTTFLIDGAYTWYSSFEVTNSDPERVISVSGSNPQERRGEGVYVLGVGIKVINLVIYDTGEGLSCWTPAENNEYYGNVIFNNGWWAPDREHGHGIYAQNNSGTKSYIDNIVLNNFSFGWQFYGSANAYIKNFYLEGNVMLNDRWLIGGSTPAENIDVNNNFTYKDTVEFGYTNNVQNSGLTLRNNVFSSSVLLSFWKNVTATNNKFYTGYSYGFPITMMFNGAPDVTSYNFNNNTYYWSNPPSPYQAELAINWVNFPLPDNDPSRRGNFMLTKWRQMGKDVNSTIKGFPLIDDRNYAISGTDVYVRKNKYDAKRANIIIYNYDKQDYIPVDVSGVLAVGDNYELHNVQNYFGDVITGKYNGGLLSVPMNNHTVAKPLGYNYELGKNSQKEFQTFVLVNTNTGNVSAKNTPPVANAGADLTIQLPSSSTTLNASQSSDADGNISAYNWTKIAGPSSFSLSSATTSSVTVSNLVEGTYTFRVTVTDNKGATATDDVNVVVKPAPAANKAPVANAGNNVAIQLPVNSTTLSAANSADADGTITGYYWTKVSGPSSYNFSTLNLAATTVSNLTEGVYVFRMTVTDNAGASSTADVTVTVNAAQVANTPPVSNAGADITMQLPVNYTTLNGSQSYDADGSISTYNWAKIAGPSSYAAPEPTLASSHISDLAAGVYTFRLTVTDNKGASSYDDINITVNAAAVAAPKPPVALAGNDESVPVGQATVLHGETSYANNGNITTYQWTKYAGPSKYEIVTPTSSTSWIRNLDPGSYVFRLTVTDSYGATATDDVAITVYQNNPVANAGNDVTIQLPVSSVTLDGSKSSIPSGISVTYNWSKTSGPSQCNLSSTNAASVTAANLAAGSYSFRLTLTASNGASCTDDVNVTVNAAAVTNPVVPGVINAGEDVTIMMPLNYASLLATINLPSDRYAAGFKWTKLTGPSQYFITSSNTSSTTMNYLVQGSYTFRITLTDNKGSNYSDDVVVNVLPAGSAIARSSAPLEENNVPVAGKLSIYPNPVMSTINLNWTNEYKGKASIAILDINGKTVKRLTVEKASQIFQKPVDASMLKPGVYLLEIRPDAGKSFTEKFIKN